MKKELIILILIAIFLTSGCINNNNDNKDNKRYSSCLAEMKYLKMNNSEIKNITNIIESFSIDFDQSNLMFHFYHRENNTINSNYTIFGTIINNNSTIISLQFGGTKKYESDKEILSSNVIFIEDKLGKNLIDVKYSPQYKVV